MSLCIIVSSCPHLACLLEEGLRASKKYELFNTFRSAAECYAFINTGGMQDRRMFPIVDSYLDLKLPSEGGPTALDGQSPSTLLMEYIYRMCPRWCSTSITRAGCSNDAQIALLDPPHWYAHSSDMIEWNSTRLLESALDRSETVRDINPLPVE